MTHKVLCPRGCGEYEHIGQHWSKGDVCIEPELSENQKEIITGCLMGDGFIDYSDKNPSFGIILCEEEYLKYIDEIFGILTTGVRMESTAKEKAEENRQRGFRPDADEEDYSDQYILPTRNLEQLSEYADWYSSGEKVFPEEIELTPTTLKHWYVCDGSYSMKEESVRGNIVLSLNNEAGNEDKIESYFEDSVGCSVDYWREYETREGRIDLSAVFHADTTEELFEYMGSPLPGFEYKWPA